MAAVSMDASGTCGCWDMTTDTSSMPAKMGAEHDDLATDTSVVAAGRGPAWVA